jgi:hypothetical protein
MIYSSANAWSFGGAKKETQYPNQGRLNTVGPGSYNDDAFIKTKKSVPNFSFGKGERIKTARPLTPGPGDYEGATNGLFGKEAPKFSMGKSEKATIFSKTAGSFKSAIPGPGQYQLDSNVLDKTKKKAPGYKMALSPKGVNYENNKPGPGQYEVHRASLSSPKWKMTTSKRDTTNSLVYKNLLSTPGPGNYKVESDFGKGPKVIKLI